MSAEVSVGVGVHTGGCEGVTLVLPSTDFISTSQLSIWIGGGGAGV